MLVTQDPEKAYSYVCVFRLPYKHNKDEEPSDDQEPGESEEAIKDKSDSRGKYGRSCVCFKLTAEHPEHALITTTEAGLRGYYIQLLHFQLRPQRMACLRRSRVCSLALSRQRVMGKHWAICETAGLFYLNGVTKDYMQIGIYIASLNTHVSLYPWNTYYHPGFPTQMLCRKHVNIILFLDGILALSLLSTNTVVAVRPSQQIAIQPTKQPHSPAGPYSKPMPMHQQTTKPWKQKSTPESPPAETSPTSCP